MTDRSPSLLTDAVDVRLVINPGGHAHDGDVIIADSGRILRLVGIHGVQGSAVEGTVSNPQGTYMVAAYASSSSAVCASGVRSTGGFLNFNYDYFGPTVQRYGSDNDPTTYDQIIARAVEHLAPADVHASDTHGAVRALGATPAAAR